MKQGISDYLLPTATLVASKVRYYTINNGEAIRLPLETSGPTLNVLSQSEGYVAFLFNVKVQRTL
jgi:hypothetical protein